MSDETENKEIVNKISELTEILKQAHSLPFLFIGAGFSRRYLKKPSEDGLCFKF
jgi:hypothetical protein